MEARGGILVKGYRLQPFAKNVSKNIGKNLSKEKVSGNTARNLLIMLNNLQQIHLKLVQKKQFKKQQKQLLI